MSETINKRINRLRKAKGYTQEYVAKLLNLKTSTYSQMERQGGITSDMIIELSKLLEVNPLILLFGENHTENKNLHEIIKKVENEKDIPEIPYIITKNLYEKLTIIAMRNLPQKDNKDIYKYVLEKLKNV